MRPSTPFNTEILMLLSDAGRKPVRRIKTRPRSVGEERDIGVSCALDMKSGSLDRVS